MMQNTTFTPQFGNILVARQSAKGDLKALSENVGTQGNLVLEDDALLGGRALLPYQVIQNNPKSVDTYETMYPTGDIVFKTENSDQDEFVLKQLFKNDLTDSALVINPPMLPFRVAKEARLSSYD